jgi:carbonic anhydrase
MRLFEAIVEANRRTAAAGGDRRAAEAVSIPSRDLPIAALTCIDARLNHLLPEALGIPEEQFIWLRNAGNIITSPVSSTMRSLAMACAIKGAKEIVIIGHTDCLIGRTTALQLIDRLAALGVDRQRLPENLVEYFGLFGTERQNVMKAVDLVRSSPLIGAAVPVHGLMLDLKTGRIEWTANGYEGFETVAGRAGRVLQQADGALETLAEIGNLAVGDLKFPATRIGEFVTAAHDLIHQAEAAATAIGKHQARKSAAATDAPPPLRLGPKFGAPRPPR